jgi:hypothetical protein
MAIEAVVAVAILVATALAIGHVTATTGSASTKATSRSSAAAAGWTGWQATGVPAITSLVDDLTAAGSATAPPSGSTANGATIGTDAAQLDRDLVAARRQAPPPSNQATAAWSQALAQVATAVQGLRQAAPDPTTEALATAHREVTAAGNTLLALGQQVQAGR